MRPRQWLTTLYRSFARRLSPPADPPAPVALARPDDAIVAPMAGKSSAATIALVLFLLVGLVSIAAGLHNALAESNDTQWWPSRFLLLGHDPYRAYLDFIHGLPSPYPHFLNQVPNYPAFGLFFLWPLAALPWPAARLAWGLSNVLFAILLIYLLYRICLAKWRPVLTLLLFAFFVTGMPFRNTLTLGQQGLFAVLCFTAAVYAQQRDKKFLGALFLAISWFKYSLTFPLSILFLTRKGWPIVAGAVAINLILTLGLALWIHENPLTLLWEPIAVARQGGVWTGTTDLFSIAQILGLKGEGLVAALDLVIVAAALVARFRATSGDEYLVITMLSLVALVWCVHSSYDIVVLMLPVCYLLSASHRYPASFDRASVKIMLAMLAYAILYFWYFARVLDGAAKMFPGPVLGHAVGAFYWSGVLGLYSSLALAIALILRGDEAGNRGSG
jgi:hypothetical protein